MRTQLAAAQRRDPLLFAIIRALEREPRGNYASDNPVLDGRRLKARLYKYRLASDGVLVARSDNNEPTVDRPVVPDAPYEYGTDRAPSNMTWKHLLLGAVHNPITGLHKKAVDMASELDRLVAWWPPESLRPDCKKWVERCRLCTSVHWHQRQEPMFKTIIEHKAFARLYIDFMAVEPTGLN